MVFDTIKIARDYQADVRREWAEIRGKRQAKADDERRKFEKSWYERLRATALYAINYVNGEFGEPNSADYKDLLLSAVQGESDRVKKWIFKFGKVDGAVDCRSPLDRKTALMLAAQNKDDASVSHLVNANASTTIADCFGRTALHYACAAGDPECAEILLIGGAQVDAQDDQGRTPLMDAASGPSDECVDVLCEYGASLDMRDRTCRWTALHFAAAAGNVEAAEILLETGASYMLRSKLGEKAHDVALNHHHQNCAILLHDWEESAESVDDLAIPSSDQRAASRFSDL